MIRKLLSAAVKTDDIQQVMDASRAWAYLQRVSSRGDTIILRDLAGPIRGIVSLTLYGVNTVFWCLLWLNRLWTEKDRCMEEMLAT